MESDPVLDPTVRLTDYVRSHTNGPRGTAVAVYDSDVEKLVTTSGMISDKPVEVTPIIAKEINRLQQEYMVKKTLEHHKSLRLKGNISALKLLGLTVLAYAYMGLSLTFAELNL